MAKQPPGSPDEPELDTLPDLEEIDDLPMTAGRGDPLAEVADRAFAEGEPSKVLFLVTTSDVGGTESFLERMVSRIDRQLFSPVVCSLCPPGGVGQRIAESGTQVLTLDMAKRARPWQMLRGSLRLADTIDRLGIDLVQGLLYRANVMGAIATRLSKRRPVMVAGQRSLTPMTGPAATLAQRLTRPLIHRTVAVSEAVRQRLVEDEGVDPEAIVVIDNGVDTETYHPLPARDLPEARRRLGLPEGGLLVGAVGRLTPVKGFDHLLEALSALAVEGLDLHLALVGDGPERQSLEKRCATLGLGEIVSFLGVRRDLPEIFPAFNVFCLPSIREGSPQVLLEAMACGCPVVASTAGGIPEVVENGVSGLLVKPGSTPGLTDALRRTLTDEGLRRTLAAGGRRRILHAFDLTRGVRAHEALYGELLGLG
jgi:glycosyltransferase involved in cell wall biosynthesis